jgi:hypothetical protein
MEKQAKIFTAKKWKEQWCTNKRQLLRLFMW